MKTRDMQIAEAVQDAVCEAARLTGTDYLRAKFTDLAAVIASVPKDEPVAWEYRAYYGTNTAVPGWGAWKRVEASQHGFTVLDAVNDLKQYIAHGYKYELRALYTSPQPNPNPRRKAIKECIAHAKSYLDYHAKATAEYSSSCHAAMEYHRNRVNAASDFLDETHTLLNRSN